MGSLHLLLQHILINTHTHTHTHSHTQLITSRVQCVPLRLSKHAYTGPTHVRCHVTRALNTIISKAMKRFDELGAYLRTTNFYSRC